MSKVIVITGASSGIGEATARRLAADGNQVVLAARRAERLNSIVADITAEGGTAIAVPTDVTKKADVEALAAAALEKFGRIDVWVNNAGLMPNSEMALDRVDDWDRMIDVNLRGTLYGIHAVLPYMRKEGKGQIVNVASVAAHITDPGSAVYAGTKSAVQMASEILRKEEAMAKSNIRVTTISPGAIDTELPQRITVAENRESTEKFYEQTAIPADEVAKCIEFAINMDERTSINEIILRPTAQVI